MKRYLIVGVAAVFAVYSCGRRSANRHETTTSTATDTADWPMTVVGCLVSAGTTVQRDEDSNSSNPQPPVFTLVNVELPAPADAAPSHASGTSGTVSSSGQTGVRASFRLVADKDRLDDLQRFANSRVEVTGSVVPSTGTGVADVGAGSASAGAPPGDVRRMRIKDVRQVEPTCGVSKKE